MQRYILDPDADRVVADQPCAVPLRMRLEESANPFDIGRVEFPCMTMTLAMDAR
jgi:hypothetical protein